jgi:hypothetical protein
LCIGVEAFIRDGVPAGVSGFVDVAAGEEGVLREVDETLVKMEERMDKRTQR